MFIKIRRFFISDSVDSLRPAPNIDYLNLSDKFLLSAIISLLGVRLYLHLTGYPQIGGDTLHIAHMLWGGFLMALSILIGLAFLDERSRKIQAIVGGLGFGVFIDELGKFITKDNDYFYQPTIALIYVIFIAFYLVIRHFARKRRYSQRDYLANALSILQSAELNTIDQVDYNRLVSYLDLADTGNPIVQDLRFRASSLVPTNRIEEALVPLIGKKAVKRIFSYVNLFWLIVVAGIHFGFQLIALVVILYDSSLSTNDVLEVGDVSAWTHRLVSIDAYVLSFVVYALLLLVGIVKVIGFRQADSGLHWIRRALLVNIFVVHIFMFYHEQLSAVFGLIASVIILSFVDYLDIHRGK